MAIDTIHPVIIARDAAATIELTLTSLRAFEEIIVYDHGSRDRTGDICSAYPNVQLVDGEFLGGGRTRNYAASLAEGDWILALSAGEYLSDGLIASLRTLHLSNPDSVYSLDCHRLLMGRDMHWGGWGNRWVVRLYNRQRYQFNDAPIDERLILASDTRVTAAKGALWHEAAPTLDALIQDIGLQASLRQHTMRRVLAPPLIVLWATASFMRSYVLKLGMLEGWRGLVIAAAASIEVFFRLMQRYTSERSTRPSPIYSRKRARLD